MDTQKVYAQDASQQVRKVHTSPVDFFLYLGAIVALYLSVISVLTLLFEIINQVFPKPLAYIDPYAGDVSFAIAMLIVAFPIYLLLVRVTSRNEMKSPEKRELWVRKWLIFATLFVAGLSIAIDFMVLFRTFFAGEEITTGFILKVLSLALVLATVFGYYMYDIRHSIEEGMRVGKRFAYGSVVFAVAVISIGFLVMGSPYTQREKRYDAERVSNLQGIQSQITSYWQSKQKLPVKIEDLNDSLGSFTLPVDPKTKASYVYNVKGKYSFELCAMFGKETPKGTGWNQSPYKTGINENWDHTAGQVCFVRTIDPQLYPPYTSQAKFVPTPVPAY